MKSILKTFREEENGYVLVLSLILLPVFLGFGLLIIDVGRGNNAHADLSAAADAVALAGARELDGTAGAIARAHSAMAQLTNNVSMLARQGADMEIELVYENTAGNEFRAVFLRGIPGSTPRGASSAIPGNDTTPIDGAFLTTWGTTDDALAEYVYVYAQSRNLETAFFNPANFLPSSVPVSATAVAKSVSAVCDFTPLYICNPFEATLGYSGPGLVARWAAGDLHGRLLRLHPKGNGTHTPGNFGFLQVEGDNGNTSASASALRSVFAGRRPGSCFEAGQVTTKPGAAVSIAQGINTKFDIFAGPYNNYPSGQSLGFSIAPAVNVRKGYIPRPQGNSGNYNDCSIVDESDDHFLDTSMPLVWNGPDDTIDGPMGLPDNAVMEIVSTSVNGTAVPGAIVGRDDWPIDLYFQRNYGVTWNSVMDPVADNSFSGILSSSPGANVPSRYDVYRWEIDNNYHQRRSVTGGESGQPNCQGVAPRVDPDPRLIYAAIIDCQDPNSIAQGGGINVYNVSSYAELFMTRPMGKNGNGNNASTTTYVGIDGSTVETSDATIDVEIVRVTGAGASGVLENFVRNESILVR